VDRVIKADAARKIAPRVLCWVLLAYWWELEAKDEITLLLAKKHLDGAFAFGNVSVFDSARPVRG
jgi:hypothetical protein